MQTSRTPVGRTDDVLVATVVVATVAAGFSGAAPTGTGWWDLVLRAALAAIFVIASKRASPPLLVGAATIGAVFVGLGVWLVVAALATLAALIAYARSPGGRDVAAISAALTIQALLHLAPVGFFGLPSLLATVAVTAVVGSAIAASSPTSRQRITRVVVVLVAAVTVMGAAGGALALTARSHVSAGVDAARRGLEQARAGDPDLLADELAAAQEHLGSASGRLESPLLFPLRLIPIAAQHHRSVTTGLRHAKIVVDDVVEVTAEVDVEQLQLRQGRFDLDAVQRMAPGLERAVTALSQARAAIAEQRNPWLLPVVDDRIGELLAEIETVLPEAQLSAEAARVLPAMLGANGERRYLTLFGSPGESREFGGFVGGYALLGVDGGDLSLIKAGSVLDLVPDAAGAGLVDPAGYPVEYRKANPEAFPQNLTASPNMSVIARAVRDIFPELEGRPIDGVIYADPYALAAMTELTGPIAVEGVDGLLDAESLPRFLFDRQYRIFDTRDERFGTIGAIAEAMATRLATASLPGPQELGRVLGPAARAGRLQMMTYDDGENAFLSNVRLQRAFVAPGSVDSVAVIQTNATASKLDLYLRREVDYQVAVDRSGALAATVEVKLRSEVPEDAPELALGLTDGTNEVLLSLYSEHQLERLLVDGRDHDYVVHEEFGFYRYALFVIALDRAATATVRFELSGVAPPDPYRLVVWSQPLVNPDTITVRYTQADGELTEWQGVLHESLLLEPHGG